MSTGRDINKLLREVEEAGHVTIGFTDIDGIVRGKMIDYSKFKKSIESDLGFCNVSFAWDMHDGLYPDEILPDWDQRYPDGVFTLDKHTYRNLPWNNNTPFLLGDFRNDNHLSSICPRSLLQKLQNKASGLGYKVHISAEYEWFNFTIDLEKKIKDYSPITEGMFGYSISRLQENKSFLSDIWHMLGQFQVPLEGLHTETGPGVYEAAIQYTNLIDGADRAALFKHGIKCIAKAHHIMPSFMAKFKSNLPGCGGHIHQSISDGKGNNLFHHNDDHQTMSDLMQSYLAGILHCAPQVLPMYAPTINSYKRLTGDWAATTVSWGHENRTAAFRVISKDPQSTRIENRLPGADANPYLAMAATVASGLYGIENNLPLTDKAVKGSAYKEDGLPTLATSLKEATLAMERSELPTELFGEEFVRHFIATRKAECRLFEKAVTNWEAERYREII